MTEDPLLLAMLILGSGYMANLWYQDLRNAQAGPPNASALPGALPCSTRAIAIASLGAIALLGMETAGEYQLNIDSEQSTMTALFAVYSLTAAFTEELIFRGYLVYEKRGIYYRNLGIICASIIFALIHPYLWKWEDDQLMLNLTTKGLFSTIFILLNSLWFYYVRFAHFNTNNSLAPCIAAHFTKNAGVIIIKAFSGFISGWW